MINAAFKYLSSLRCTLALLLSLTAMFLLGFVIPQKEIFQKQEYLRMKWDSPLFFSVAERLGLTEVYTSPITLVLWFFFFLNLTLVMRQRIPAVKNRVTFTPARLEDPLTAAGYPTRISVPPRPDGDAIPAALAGAGYRFHGDTARFYAVRNPLSPLATLLFHLSFFLVLVAAAVTTYTKFVGYVELGVGESFHGELSRYKGSPRMPKVGTPPPLAFTLEQVRPMVEQNVATGLQVMVRDSHGILHTANINRPYKTGATSVLVNDLGIAPLVIIRDMAGRDLDGAYIKLDLLKGKPDRFTMLGYQVEATFFPDHAVIDGVDVSRSDAFNNPAMHLAVTKNGSAIARGTLKPGEGLALDGVRLVVQEMPFWVRLLVVKQHGDWIAYAGFIIATLALCWRLLWYRREIIGSVEETPDGAVLHLACRCEFYRAAAGEELDRVGRLLQRGGRQ